MSKGRAYTRRKTTAKAARKPAHFLRQWRERSTREFPDGMSQETLAERSGLSVASISAYERGTNDPSLDALQKLSTALRVPRGMIVDVDPTGEPGSWAAFLMAPEAKKSRD